MRTYTFPYGSGEWDGAIDVDLTDDQAARLDVSMQNEGFHLDEDPSLDDIWQKVHDQIIAETKEVMTRDGALEELREEYPDLDDDQIVEEDLGCFSICFPNAFDWIKKG